jgi:hypothetical protein
VYEYRITIDRGHAATSLPYSSDDLLTGGQIIALDGEGSFVVLRVTKHPEYESPGHAVARPTHEAHKL